MKKLLLLLISSLVLGFIAVSMVGCDFVAPPATKTSVSSGPIFSQQSTGIWVTGEGKVSVVPDVAILSLGIEAQADTVAEAQSRAAAAMGTVVAELDNYGIARKDIETRHFTIYPVRRWVEDKEILLGYRVNNMVTVKVRRVADSGAVIDAAAGAGGDYIRINSINFTVDDPSAYHEEARKKAMADAEAKAKQLADSAGVKLDTPTYINESGGSIPVPSDYYKGVPEAISAPAPTPITPGETEIRLTVQVVYSIK